MAGDWIPMRLDLYEDPAVTYMADKLQCREETIVGYLHRVWSWASRQCHDGSVTNVTLMSLGRVTNVAGFPELMRDAGWLVETQDDQGRPCVVFPKWENWMSESAKKRLQDAKRQAKRRSSAVSKSHADVTKMSRSGCDKSVTTGQDSTGENNIKKENTHARENRSEAFVDAWSRWRKHLNEQFKPLTVTSEQQQLYALDGAFNDEADKIGAVQYSIQVGAKNLILTGEHRQKAKNPKRSDDYIYSKLGQDV